VKVPKSAATGAFRPLHQAPRKSANSDPSLNLRVAMNHYNNASAKEWSLRPERTAEASGEQPSNTFEPRKYAPHAPSKQGFLPAFGRKRHFWNHKQMSSTNLGIPENGKKRRDTRKAKHKQERGSGGDVRERQASPEPQYIEAHVLSICTNVSP
jgi:hypothetical protein